MRCDVLIAGGGPAGLAAAIALRLRGADVLVADALAPPIDKACGEGLMPDSQEELAALGVSLPEKDCGVFEGIAFVSRRAEAIAAFAGGLGRGVRRTFLHEALHGRAVALGVRFAWGKGIVLDAAGGAQVGGALCRYEYLVGADGQSSRVRQWSGLDEGARVERRFGARRHFRLPGAGLPWSRWVEVHWGESGQAYITPVGENEICVATLARNPRAGWEGVLRDLPALKNRLASAVTAGPLRGAVTATRRLHRVTSGRVALTGDASGSVDAVSGNGLALAFRQAKLLARSIAEGDLAIYESGHRAILEGARAMSRLMLQMDRSPWFRERTIAMLSNDSLLFSRLVAVHLGERSLKRLLLRNGAEICWRMLAPAAPAP